jgi:ABC-type proline/glycine betaine transport system permease subunit
MKIQTFIYELNSFLAVCYLGTLNSKTSRPTEIICSTILAYWFQRRRSLTVYSIYVFVDIFDFIFNIFQINNNSNMTSIKRHTRYYLDSVSHFYNIVPLIVSLIIFFIISRFSELKG